VEHSVAHTIAYADVFDYPLTASEVHRYLVGIQATPAEVDRALLALVRDGLLISRDGYFAFREREPVIAMRQGRALVAATLWEQARRYTEVIAALPFVRMVAVTGALAADNVEPDADIDYLIVTEVGRLWLCRLAVIAVVRLAARRGDIVCPNYFLTERALALQERNLFAARELAQMVPLVGSSTYQLMRRLNVWTQEFLPNSSGPPPRSSVLAHANNGLKRVTEAALRTPPGAWLDRWEMQRKIRKFAGEHNAGERSGSAEVAFAPDWCKGHFDGHGHRIMAAYHERLQRYNLEQFNLEQSNLGAGQVVDQDAGLPSCNGHPKKSSGIADG
jgi:hypothetical protein